MKKQRFHLYHIDMKYIRDIAKVDDNVMSVSPQIGKERRPFVGVVAICDGKKYCIPLTSPKPKHQTMKNDKDFTRMFDKNNKLIGCLNFNNMIPVDDVVLLAVDMKISNEDNPKTKFYKALLNDQLDWCNDHYMDITNKAEKLYKIVTETPDKMKSLTGRCCNFKKLELVLNKWVKDTLRRQRNDEFQYTTPSKKI